VTHRHTEEWSLNCKLLITGVIVAAAVTPVWATETDADSRGAVLEELIVTGTRAPDRTALTSMSPVDVVSAEKLQKSGYPDLARALEFTEPAVNFPRPQTTPTAANTRAVTLRGLSPDEVLVLVNGKRWHTTAVINTNFAVGRGSAPFDLSTIPVSAIDHIEVLRDGAAAQYGSDAIAGVINIILKSNSSGGIVGLDGGVTEKADGAHGDMTFSTGHAFGAGGRVTVSGQAGKSGATNRAAIDQRYGRITYRIGDPDAVNVNLAISAAHPLLWSGSELYDDLLISRKDSTSTPNFRPPGTSPLYPNGYRPRVNPVIWDTGNTLGLRGALPGDVGVDLSNTFGYSHASFTAHNTSNPALGLTSPTEFHSGVATYWQDVTDLNFTRSLPDVLAGANLAAGLEYRHEYYTLGRGDPLSYFGAGSDGFPGFDPRIPVDNSRNAQAAFVDVELKPVQWLSIEGAGRYDHYADFGGAATWKASARAEATHWLALRASASSGFRAPSLQQEYYSSITSVANGANKAFVNVGTYQVGDPIARALGATPLQAEKSHDISAGIVLEPTESLSFTADVFRTDIDHRIALSDALSGAAVTSVLTQAGITNVQQAAFFTNALNTRTQGYDVTARYVVSFNSDTSGDVSVAFERSPTEIRSLASNPVLPALALIGVHARTLLTQAQPKSKLTSQATISHGRFSSTLAVTRYGEYVDAPILDPQTFGAKTIVDLSFSAQLGPAVFTIGALNLGDVYPDQLQQQALAYKSFGGSYLYGEESPWGVAGREYYARAQLKF
jgi:iron complex outermembrane receptor protein